VTELLFANNAHSTLASSIGPSDTSCFLAAGTGSKFPAPGAGQGFYMTFNDAATGLLSEIVFVTSISGDEILVMDRAQQGTAAQSWPSGTLVSQYYTAYDAGSFLQGASAGTGIAVSTAGGVATIANTGVTELLAGSNVVLSGATGAVTISLEANSGVSEILAGAGISVNQNTGNVTVTNTGVLELTAGTNTTITGNNTNLTISSATPPSGQNSYVQINVDGAFGSSNLLTFANGQLEVGAIGTTAGQLILAGAPVGRVLITPSNSEGSTEWELVLPPTAGVAGYVLSTDGTGVTSWVAGGGGGGGVSQILAGTNVTISPSNGLGTVTINAAGGGGTPGGSQGTIQYNNAGSFAGDPNFTTNGSGAVVAKYLTVYSAGDLSVQRTFSAASEGAGIQSAQFSAYDDSAPNVIFNSNAGGAGLAGTIVQIAGGTIWDLHSTTTGFAIEDNSSGYSVLKINTDDSITLGTASGGPFGAGTLNATGLYINGVAVGGGSPGGASLTLQYNNSGSFAGSSLAQGADGGIYNTAIGQDHGPSSISIGRYYFGGSEDAYGGAIFMSGVSGDVWGGTVGGQGKTVGLENKYNGGNGYMLFTVSSFSTPTASIQVDGSLFAGAGLPTAPFGVDATSTGYVVAANGVYVGVPANGTNSGLLKLANATTSYVITINAGSTAADYQIVLPTDAGSAGQALINTGAGVTTWGQPSSLFTVSTLPSAASSQGVRSMVSDSTVAAVGSFGVAVTGGGANFAPVWCDGTAWYIG